MDAGKAVFPIARNGSRVGGNAFLSIAKGGRCGSGRWKALDPICAGGTFRAGSTQSSTCFDFGCANRSPRKVSLDVDPYLSIGGKVIGDFGPI
jgi:hypothetical protein